MTEGVAGGNCKGKTNVKTGRWSQTAYHTARPPERPFGSD